MQALVISIFVWAMANAIPRVLAGAGFAVLGYSVITTLITSTLNLFTSTLSQGGAYIQLLYLAGAGEAISIIGSAMLTTAAIQSARVFIGRSS